MTERDPQFDTVALATLQFHWGGVFDFDGALDPIHLVRRCRNHGTPGPTLCGIDRFDRKGPGWSVSGGIEGAHTACADCVAAASTEYPGLPIDGMFKGLFTEALMQRLSTGIGALDDRPQ